MKDLLTYLSKGRFPYRPLITVSLSRDRLIGNLRQFIQIAPNRSIAPVLKSNAYGHGLVEVARILAHERAMMHRDGNGSIPFFVIDSYFEAVALRAAGVKDPLLVIGYTRPETIARARLRDVSFAISTIETLRAIAAFQTSIMSTTRSIFSLRPYRRRISVHLKIDTGMRRQGIMPDELDEVADITSINPSLLVTGVCSHFSDADNDDPSFTESQIHEWNTIAHQLKEKHPSIEHVHISNTDGHRFVPDAEATVSRLGIGLYGLIDGSSFSPSLDLYPAMRMETIITGVKTLKRDETVGYGNTFKADRDMTIATIPVGYYEGIDRRLSSVGKVLVSREHDLCPIVGRVSMNITVIDVSHIPDARIGMPVVVISDETSDPNSIVNMARTCDTIPYEIAVHVPGQLKRSVI